MAYEYERLAVRVEDGVAFATLANPPLNVMTLPFFGDLARFSAAVAADDAVRAVVLRSDDPDFWIAHFDVEAILAFPTDGAATMPTEHNAFHVLCERLRTMPKATIAVVAGRVGGGGAELAASCDMRFGADNVLDILDGYDVVVDGTDNFPTRYLLNDASLLKRIPVVHGSIFRFEGQVTVFDPYNGPCYRCLLPEPPPPELAPSCAEAGVLGVLPGIIGSIQALEAIKLILGLGDSLAGRLLAYDALEQSFRTYKVLRDPRCPACGEDAGEIVIAEYDQHCLPHAVLADGSTSSH